MSDTNFGPLTWSDEADIWQAKLRAARSELASSTGYLRRVVHCKRQQYDVYIGRPSKWGNPFEIGIDGDRATVIEKYRAWLQTQPELLKSLPELKDKVLGCWCAPKPCHGDVLVELLGCADNDVI